MVLRAIFNLNKMYMCYLSIFTSTINRYRYFKLTYYLQIHIPLIIYIARVYIHSGGRESTRVHKRRDVCVFSLNKLF